MSNPSRTWPGLLAAGLLAALFFAADVDAAEVAPTHPVVAGFERFAADPKTEPVELGLLLLGELNCISCHRAEPGFAAHVNLKQAPRLEGVGTRARPAFLRSFVSAPHASKPGTTMPDLFGGWEEKEKTDAVDALTHFLASGGVLSYPRRDRRAIAAGKTLYHQVGCAVCHGPLGQTAPSSATPVVPLGPLETKYTVPALTAFLLDPLKVRPSGRMPAMLLKPEEASQIARFLLKDLAGEYRPNLDYQYYETDTPWDKLPDFSKLKPRVSGRAEGFDLSVARRTGNVGVRFRGTLRIEREGQYTFLLRSDDGSKLWIDNELVVDNDGIHPAQEKQGQIRLKKGTQNILVEVFNAGGEFELDVDFSGPGISPQSVAGFLMPTENARRNVADKKAARERFVIEPELADKGREVFARLGCASCHTLNDQGKPIVSRLDAPPLATLTAGKGCLSRTPGKRTPRYDLSDRQHAALTAALGAVSTLSARPPSPAETITRTLTTFNCYACHQRDGRGGVETWSNDLFMTTQKEMGDEGRVPPPLNGVGAKLNEAYLKAVLDGGAKDRPYMLTRMPRFGGENGSPLVAALTSIDKIEPVATPTFEETPRRVKSDGRFLVGGMALGCIKCHTFNGSQAEGIQAIDMTVMTRRLRHDWFHRYVVNPVAFRPGTRMPTGWPDGKSSLPKLLGGDTARQVEAVWQFLADGPAAAAPYGLGRESIPLFVINETVIYRGFIQGAGPRAIGVGYPEKANLAFDANDLRIALIWQGGFMDASKHWSGRGEGFQPPMGDNVLTLPSGPSFASLASQSDVWPSRSSRALGYHFHGYRLDKDRRPTFLYDLGMVRVEDRPEGVSGPKTAGLKRTLTLSQTADETPTNLYLRAAVGTSIKPHGDGWFLVNGEWKVRIQSSSEAVVRSSGGTEELLVPIKFVGKSATVVEQFEW